MEAAAALLAVQCATAGMVLAFAGEWRWSSLAWTVAFLIQTLRLIVGRARRAG